MSDGRPFTCPSCGLEYAPTDKHHALVCSDLKPPAPATPEAARIVYEDAARDLGAHLGPSSVVDLLMDNTDVDSADEARELAIEAGIYDEWLAALDAEQQRIRAEAFAHEEPLVCDSCEEPLPTTTYEILSRGDTRWEMVAFCDSCAEAAHEAASANEAGLSFPAQSDCIAIREVPSRLRRAAERVEAILGPSADDWDEYLADLPALSIEDDGDGGWIISHPALYGALLLLQGTEAFVGHPESGRYVGVSVGYVGAAAGGATALRFHLLGEAAVLAERQPARPIVLEGAALDDLVAALRAPRFPYRLSLAVEDGAVRFKVNQGAWSPPYPL